MRSPRLPFSRWDWALAGLLAGYVVLVGGLGRFVGMDEVFFKAPGREWAATGRFAAPELQGFLNLRPPVEKVWFVHPPVYPFLFGLYTRAVGFGPRQCVVFDAVIHAAVALLTYLLARRVVPELPDRWRFVLAAGILPIGIFCRPDELAICWGLLGLLPLLPPYRHGATVFFAGAMLGLCTATSVGAGILIGILALVVLVAVPVPFPRKLLHLSLLAYGGLFAVVAAIGPVLWSYPDAYRQYLTHAAAHVGRGSFWKSYFTGWEYEQFHRSVTAGCLLVAVCGLIWRTPDGGWKRWAGLWLGPFLGLVLLAVWLPDKVYYTWFLGPWMIVAAAATLYRMAPRLSPLAARVMVVLLVLPYGVAVAPFFKTLAVMATLPPSQSLAENARLIRSLIPAGTTVLTDDYWWVLAEDHRVFDLYFARPNPAEIDFIILSGNGSGDPSQVREVPEYLKQYLPDHFRPVENTINTRCLSVFGRTIPGTAQGYGALVLARSSPRDKIASATRSQP